MCLKYGRFQPKRAYKARYYKARALKKKECCWEVLRPSWEAFRPGWEAHRPASKVLTPGRESLSWDGRTDEKSPYSTGLRPLSGPLPCYFKDN